MQASCVRLSILRLVLVTATIIQPVQASRDNCDSINVSGDTNSFPVSYTNMTTQKPIGIGYDLTHKIGKYLDIPVNVKPRLPWARIMNMAREGELDVIAGVVPNVERAKYLYFTEPFYIVTMYAYVHHTSNIHLTHVTDLLNYKRVEIRDYSIGEELDTLLRATTEIVNEKNQVISLILTGRADYFISTKLDISLLQRKDDEWKKFKQLSLPITTFGVVLAVSKASPCAKHINQFNQVIKKNYPTDQK